MIQTDRSRVLAYQACPRKRWLEYHYQGKGIQRVAKALPLVFGAAFHEGTPLLLKGDVDGAVLRAQLFLSVVFEGRRVGMEPVCKCGHAKEVHTTTRTEMGYGDIHNQCAKCGCYGYTLPVPGGDDEDLALQYGMEEQAAMAEGLLRGWWAWEGERFMEEFEVLEVEREGRAFLVRQREVQLPFPNDKIIAVDGEEMVLMFRPDALIREKLTGDLYILSWKTCATFMDKTVRQAKVDMQSCSEVWGVQEQQKQEVLSTTQIAASQGIQLGVVEPRIEGVLYKFIVKGQRRLDKWDGLYKQGSHLAYGWRKVSDDEEWSWAWEWPREDNPYKMSTLGKGWKKVPIWREYPGGVEAWIDALANQEIFPRHVSGLEKVFPVTLPVSRRPDEIEIWKRQTVAQELKVAEDLEFMKNSEDLTPEEYAMNLDERFPQYTHSCFNYSQCPMYDACWTEAVKADPIGSGLYQIREANHPEDEDE